MAQLKDLMVTGPSSFMSMITITTINAPESDGSSTKSFGSPGEVLISNGSSVYWGNPTATTITGLKQLTIGSTTCQVVADADITIPIYNGSYN